MKKAGAVDDVPPSEVLPGSLIEVRPGERVPLDGVVTGGFSVLDTSAMTGESLPVEAGSGSPVLAGYINGQGVLEVRTERDWRHSALAWKPHQAANPLWRGGCPHFPAFIRRW